MNRRKTTPTPEAVRYLTTWAARQFGMKREDVTGPCSRRRHCDARKLAAVALKAAGMTSQEIGDVLGGRHNSGVCRILQTARDLADTDTAFRRQYEAAEHQGATERWRADYVARQRRYEAEIEAREATQ